MLIIIWQKWLPFTQLSVFQTALQKWPLCYISLLRIFRCWINPPPPCSQQLYINTANSQKMVLNKLWFILTTRDNNWVKNSLNGNRRGSSTTFERKPLKLLYYCVKCLHHVWWYNWYYYHPQTKTGTLSVTWKLWFKCLNLYLIWCNEEGSDKK